MFTARLPKNRDQAICLIAADPAGSLPGLAAKLPHYHKYSYLAFAQFPMTVFLPGKQRSVKKVALGKLSAREPLIIPDPLYSRERMMETMRFLSSEDLGGRGFGTPGLDRAADYIAKKIKEAGFVPAGDKKGSYFQAWEDIGGETAHTATLRNVIGLVPGKKPGTSAQSVVVGAHYDHLGLVWPETRDKSPGKIHPGADNNASGVAVLIELARVLAKGPRPDRTIVFAAFTGEGPGNAVRNITLLAKNSIPSAIASVW